LAAVAGRLEHGDFEPAPGQAHLHRIDDSNPSNQESGQPGHREELGQTLAGGLVRVERLLDGGDGCEWHLVAHGARDPVRVARVLGGHVDGGVGSFHSRTQYAAELGVGDQHVVAEPGWRRAREGAAHGPPDGCSGPRNVHFHQLSDPHSEEARDRPGEHHGVGAGDQLVEGPQGTRLERKVADQWEVGGVH